MNQPSELQNAIADLANAVYSQPFNGRIHLIRHRFEFVQRAYAIEVNRQQRPQRPTSWWATWFKRHRAKGKR